jgi:murein DD-endopeptidase MepM/ murein hydrolase activator NlpD
MSRLLDISLEYAVKKNFITQAEAEPLKQAINTVMGKHGLPVEWFCHKAFMETGFNNPMYANGKSKCKGLSQVCPWGTVAEGMSKELGVSVNQVPSIFVQKSPAEQTILWGKYQLDTFLTPNVPKPSTAGEFYCINLYPASFLYFKQGKGTADTDIGVIYDGKPLTGQAQLLYSNGVISMNSMDKGLKQHTVNTLSPMYPEVVSLVGVETIGTSTGTAGTGMMANTARVEAYQQLLLVGKDCDRKRPTTIAEALTYIGCETKTASPLPLGGIGPGNANGLVGVTGSDATAISGAINPNQASGQFIYPMDMTKNGGKFWKVSSPFRPPHRPKHNGVDISSVMGSSPGQNILASASGTVTHASFNNGGYGNMVDINHGNGYVTRYAHLYKIGVTKGQQVVQGQVLGIEGTTGRSTGTHLHFEIHQNGVKMNPENFVKLR